MCFDWFEVNIEIDKITTIIVTILQAAEGYNQPIGYQTIERKERRLHLNITFSSFNQF